MTLYLVAQGATEWNLERRRQGPIGRTYASASILGLPRDRVLALRLGHGVAPRAA